jgi:hypothetical protein
LLGVKGLKDMLNKNLPIPKAYYGIAIIAGGFITFLVLFIWFCCFISHFYSYWTAKEQAKIQILNATTISVSNQIISKSLNDDLINYEFVKGLQSKNSKTVYVGV